MAESSIYREYIKKFRTGREDIIAQSLAELKTKGDNDILPEIVDLLNKNMSREVNEKVLNILNNLNEQSSVDVLMENLPRYENEDFFDQLISACWQNGLNYSGHLEYFIDIVLQKDFRASFEAFTVVESNIAQLEGPEREILARKIESQKNPSDPEKASLISGLESVVKSVSGPFRIDPSP